MIMSCMLSCPWGLDTPLVPPYYPNNSQKSNAPTCLMIFVLYIGITKY